MLIRCLALIACLLLLGCEKIEQTINKTWPPVSLDAQRAAGIEAGIKALSLIDTPDILLSVDPALLRIEAERNLASRVPELRNPKVSFVRQAAIVVGDFDFKPQEADLQLKGSVSGGASIKYEAGAIVILPAFETVSLTSVVYKGKLDASTLTPLVNSSIRTFLKNINSTFSTEPRLRIPVHTSLGDTIDVSNLLKDGATASGTLSYNIALKSAALLIDDQEVSIIVDVEPGNVTKTPASSAPNTTATYDQYKKQFSDIAANVLKSPPSIKGAGYVAVKTRLLANMLNSAFAGAPLCAAYTSKGADIPFNTKIEPFKNTTDLDCTPTRDCNINRNCRANHDTRDCNRCLVNKPWGGCAIRGNDPFCEAAKAAQNAGYTIGYNTCLTQEAGERLDCERIKAQTKLGCEINREWLNAVRRIGSVGRVAGNATIAGRGNLCLENATIDDTLMNVTVRGNVEASLRVTGSVSFTPHDLGHLLVCVAQWQKPFLAAVSVPRQSLNVAATIETKSTPIGLEISIKTTEIPLKAQIVPAPFDAMFSQNPDLYVQCVPAALGKAVNITMKAFGKDDIAPFFGNGYEEKVPAQRFSFMVKSRAVELGNQRFIGTPTRNGDSLVYNLAKEESRK